MEIFRQLRLRKGDSLEDVGQAIGKTRAYLSFLENGKEFPSEEMVRALASYYGVDQDKLLLATGVTPKADIKRFIAKVPSEQLQSLWLHIKTFGWNRIVIYDGKYHCILAPEKFDPEREHAEWLKIKKAPSFVDWCLSRGCVRDEIPLPVLLV